MRERMTLNKLASTLETLTAEVSGLGVRMSSLEGRVEERLSVVDARLVGLTGRMESLERSYRDVGDRLALVERDRAAGGSLEYRPIGTQTYYLEPTSVEGGVLMPQSYPKPPFNVD